MLNSTPFVENKKGATLFVAPSKRLLVLVRDYCISEFINELIPITESASPVQMNNVDLLRTDLKLRYFEAPDLVDLPKSAWRVVNAVSDFATHVNPLRKTASYKENLFSKTIEGNAIIDKSYELIKAI